MGKPLHLSESTPLIGDSYEGATLTIADESNANKTKKIHLLSRLETFLIYFTLPFATYKSIINIINLSISIVLFMMTGAIC